MEAYLLNLIAVAGINPRKGEFLRDFGRRVEAYLATVERIDNSQAGETSRKHDEAIAACCRALVAYSKDERLANVRERSEIQAALDALYAAQDLPKGDPPFAAHPLGTPEREANDERRAKIRLARQTAIDEALAVLRPLLLAEWETNPTSHDADLARVYASWPPAWKPTDEKSRWMEQQDAILAEAIRAEDKRQYTIVSAAECDGGLQIIQIQPSEPDGTPCEGVDCCHAARDAGGTCHHGAFGVRSLGQGASYRQCEAALKRKKQDAH